MNEQLLKLIDGLIATLGAFKASVVTHFERETVKEAKLQAETKELVDYADELKVREEAVKKIEDVIALDIAAKKLMAEARAAVDKNNERATELDRIAIENIKRNNEELERIRVSNETLKREWATYNAAQARFAEEKQSFKEKIAQGLVELVDKK